MRKGNDFCFRVLDFSLACFIFVCSDLYVLHVYVRCVKREKELLPLERRRRRTAALLRWPEAEGVCDASFVAFLVFGIFNLV